MKSGYCHIHTILDRSGSMQSIRDDVIGGFNTFVEDQKKVAGEASITLVQFDEQDPYEIIYNFTPLSDVQPLTAETFVPRGWTPLLDAIGRGINDCGQMLAQMSESDRPEKVIFCIITDGQENRSKEFKKEQITKMVKEQTDQWKWEFLFLSCDLAAIDDAVSYGIDKSKTMSFLKSAEGTRAGYTTMSNMVKTSRTS
jgi:Mg-chelatase subunit ChlD